MKRQEIAEAPHCHINYINIFQIIFCVVIGYLNSFYYGNRVIMFVLCAVEAVVLFYDIIRREYVDYLCHYMVFLCFSMESEAFVGTSVFYGFKNFRFLGLNLAVWLMIPLVIAFLLHNRKLLWYADFTQRKVVRLLFLFLVFAIVMGLFNYVIDDNGFASATGSFGKFVEAVYSLFLPFIEICVGIWIVTVYSDKSYKIKQYLYSIIVGIAIIFMLCLVFHNYGNRGGLSSLQVSDVYFLLVAAPLLFFYEEFRGLEKVVVVTAGLTILLLSLIYNASGKIVLTAILIPVMGTVIYIQKGNSVKTLIVSVCSIIALFIIITIILPLLINKNQLLTTKFLQVQFLLKFGNNWFANLPSSPRIRVAEILNISYELIIKPWNLPFGKGICGTITDRLNLFTELNEFVFPRWELQLGAYYSMHESFSGFFLTGGLYGLWCYLQIAMICFRRLFKSPWLIFGLAWFLLFYSYHLTISIYGIVAFCVGLRDITNQELEGE